jgi:hypothetical protein
LCETFILAAFKTQLYLIGEAENWIMLKKILKFDRNCFFFPQKISVNLSIKAILSHTNPKIAKVILNF